MPNGRTWRGGQERVFHAKKNEMQGAAGTFWWIVTSSPENREERNVPNGKFFPEIHSIGPKDQKGTVGFVTGE